MEQNLKLEIEQVRQKWIYWKSAASVFAKQKCPKSFGSFSPIEQLL